MKPIRRAWRSGCLLREHLVLEHLQAHVPDTAVRYWRDKSGREVDFVLARGRNAVDVVECKWNVEAFDGVALEIFRKYYPEGRNYLVSPSAEPDYSRRLGGHELRVCTPSELWAPPL